MNKLSQGQQQDHHVNSMKASMDSPLWLLQIDETRFLYISLFLSVTVHIILFAVMAATRIFHPFTGTSQEFDLVWFSPAPVTAPMKQNAVKNQMSKNSTTKTTQLSLATKQKPVIKNPQIKKIEPPVDTLTKSLPPIASQIKSTLQTPDESPTGEPAEMIISRYGGKVIDVVEKKSEKSTFTVISSVTMKSKNSPTVVQTIRETVKETPKRQQTRQESKPAEIITKVPIPKETPILKKTEKVATTYTPSNQSSQHQGSAQEKLIQKKVSSATITAVDKTKVALPSIHRPINTFAATLETLTSVGNKQESPPLRKATIESPGVDKPSHLQAPAENTAASPPPGRKTNLTDEKQTPKQVHHSQLILHPPISGDLKLIITSVVDVKVEVLFRPFPKVRRSKPLTRWESANDRSIIPKQVRTKETVHEAVVEETEEGVYSIKVIIENGKPGTVGLALKIHESKKGARSKDLGSRKIDGNVEVAKVLMPEGILWNEDSYFTGDMEDADSITKFNSGTGLMWREYK
jgi:hypothetical protein